MPSSSFHSFHIMAFESEMLLESSSSIVNENSLRKSLEFIEEITKNTDSIQEIVLSEILSQNTETEYLKRFGLNGATDRETFKSKVPVITYEDLLPDIQRIANGDTSPILSSHLISEFLASSGTSAGERKLIPITQQEMERRLKVLSLITPVMNKYVPDLDKGKVLNFIFIKEDANTPSGLVARPLLTAYIKNAKSRKRPFNPYNVLTSPEEVILCTDSFQCMYTHMLCGLIMRHQVLRLGAVFASGLVQAIKFLQLNWSQLAHDISTGTLNPKITDPSIKECMSKILKPDPELADFVTKECSSENWECIIPRIWPNTKFIEAIVTGTMAQYIPILDYYSDHLPKVSTMYASSECFFGLNLNPMDEPNEVSYTIMPNMGYFEFLPDDNTELIDLSNVKIGKFYELIVTTYSGLYRYRVGDILQVTGFHNSAPTFKFVRRQNVLLSIDVDKTDESDLQKAIDNASILLKEFNTNIVEYTSFADTKSIPGHYVIYLELLMMDSSHPPMDEVLNKCCLVMEESLNSVYRQARVAYKSIGPLEIRVVKNGTFQKLMDFAISRGASISQYKVPRCVSFAPIIELLHSNVVSCHFSPIVPHWTLNDVVGGL